MPTNHNKPSDRNVPIIEKELLVFGRLLKGREFPQKSEKLTEEKIINFARSIGTENPLHFDHDYAKKTKFGTLVAPPMISYLLFRCSYLANAIFPGSGIAVKMEFEFLKAGKLNETLNTKTTVLDRYEREGKKYVTLESVSENQEGQKVYVTRLYAIWPK
jgi:acyl dehydratase